jgi:hypothetical protein
MDARIGAVLGGIAIIGIIVASVALGAAGATAEDGTVYLAPVDHSGVSGTAALSTTQDHQTFIAVQATGMASLTNYGFALMFPDCAAVIQLLNPIEADAAGDGGSTSQVRGTPDSSWWLGIVTAEGIAVACGHVTNGASPPATPAPGTTFVPNPPGDYPTVTPTPGNILVPVVTPTNVPTPAGTPHPAGS